MFEANLLLPLDGPPNERQTLSKQNGRGIGVQAQRSPGNELTFCDFFAGIGLFEIGMKRAGWRPTLSVDNSDLKLRAHAYHFRDSSAHYHLADVFDVHGQDLPSVTLVHASFPCTDLSLAGSRNGTEGGFQSSTIYSFLSSISEMPQRPKIISLENVKGLLTSDGGHDLRRILTTLNQLGYVVDLVLIDGAHFTPQSRERIFVLGIRDDVAVKAERFDVNIKVSDVRPKAVVSFISKFAQIKWRFFRFPKLPIRKNTLSAVVDRSAHWWCADRTEYLISQMYDRHRAWLLSKKSGSRYSYATAFRRMRERSGEKLSTAEIRTDGIAGCLRTSKGGSAKQILLRAGRGRIDARLLNLRECAALMGAPEFKFAPEISETDYLFCLGDGVCSAVVEWLAKKYFTAIARLPQNAAQYARNMVPTSMIADGPAPSVPDWFEAWLSKQTPKGDKLPYLGRLFAALVLLDALRGSSANELKANLRDEDDTGTNRHYFAQRSVKGHTASKIRHILTKRGVVIPTAARASTESGRTSGATRPAAIELFQKLKPKVLADIDAGRDVAQLLEPCIRRVIELLQKHFGREKIKIRFSPTQTVHSIVEQILQSSGNRQGSVAQHLVGAKLSLRFPEIDIAHHHAFAGDVQTAREGDYVIGDRVFHVTVSPTGDHYRKCKANVDNGKRPYLLVSERYRETARIKIEDEIGRNSSQKVVVESLQDFIGQNIDEISMGANAGSGDGIRKLIEKYNELVDQYDVDKSLMIEVVR